MITHRYVLPDVVPVDIGSVTASTGHDPEREEARHPEARDHGWPDLKEEIHVETEVPEILMSERGSEEDPPAALPHIVP